MGTIIERNGSFTARVRKGGVSKTKTFYSAKAAKTWIYHTELDIQRGVETGKIDPRGKYVGTMIDRYLREVERNPNLKVSRDKAISLRHFKAEMDALPLVSLTPQRIVEFVKMRRKTVSASTANKDVTYLGVVISYARAVWQWDIPENLIKETRIRLNALGLVSSSNRRERRISPLEERTIIAALEEREGNWSASISTLFRFALATAMRQGEILRVTWDDFDAQNGTLTIRERKHPTRKADRTDTIPLSNTALEIIHNQPRTDARIFPYSSTTVSTRFHDAMKRLNYDIRFHDTRHEAISRFFEAGLSIPEVASISGHTDWKMLERYTHHRGATLRSKIAHL